VGIPNLSTKQQRAARPVGRGPRQSTATRPTAGSSATPARADLRRSLATGRKQPLTEADRLAIDGLTRLVRDGERFKLELRDCGWVEVDLADGDLHGT